MKEDPIKLTRMIEGVVDELGDVLCDHQAKNFGTMQNMKARQLACELHEKSARLRQIFDPS